jgi:hypothetical protein
MATNESTFSAYYHIRLGAKIVAEAAAIQVDDRTSNTRNQLGGDVQVAVRDRAVLIEFKRSLQLWRTEVTKDQYKDIMQYANRKDNRSNSRMVHWFAWGNHRASNANDMICLAPYVALASEDAEELQRASISLGEFLRRQFLVDPEKGKEVGASFDVYRTYVKAICDAAKGDASGSAERGDAPPVLIWVVFDEQGNVEAGTVTGWSPLRESCYREASILDYVYDLIEADDEAANRLQQESTEPRDAKHNIRPK